MNPHTQVKLDILLRCIKATQFEQGPGSLRLRLMQLLRDGLSKVLREQFISNIVEQLDG